MKLVTTIAILVSALLSLVGCAQKPIEAYSGPPITAVVLYKERRMMYLMHDDEVMRSYEFELGFEPVGHKEVYGDGKTPEGVYRIDRRNPNSRYHLSLGISYPNRQDRSAAAALGMDPGGDIFIHGTPTGFLGLDDWTAGCIAVTNQEIEEIYAMVENGTPIVIYP